MDQSSARITNALFSTKEFSGQVNAKKDLREGTVCQIFGDSLSLVHVVDAAVCWVVLGFPVPTPEEVMTDPLVLEIEGCTGALCDRE